jgi:hypothetical protein
VSRQAHGTYGYMKIGGKETEGMKIAEAAGLNHQLKVIDTTKDIGIIQGKGIGGMKADGITKTDSCQKKERLIGALFL